MRQFEELIKKKRKILERFVERGWIGQFIFTDKHPFLVFDHKGIDLLYSFRPTNNGEIGWIGIQEKTKLSHIKTHFKKYPCVPAFLLRRGDTLNQIEYVFILALLGTQACNQVTIPEIKKRKAEIETKLGKSGILVINKHERRFWLNWKDI